MNEVPELSVGLALLCAAGVFLFGLWLNRGWLFGEGVSELRFGRYSQEDIGVNVLRHTFYSHLAIWGAWTRAIQELAGHADLFPCRTSVLERRLSAIHDPGLDR